MCLFYHKANTTKIKNRFKNNKTLTMYKVVSKSSYDKTIQSIHYGHSWTPGYNISDSYKHNVFRNYVNMDSINHGIHVYTNAWRTKKWRDSCAVIIPVVVRLKDLIGVGTNQDAVFTKVFLRKKDYLKALKS